MLITKNEDIKSKAVEAIKADKSFDEFVASLEGMDIAEGYRLEDGTVDEPRLLTDLKTVWSEQYIASETVRLSPVIESVIDTVAKGKVDVYFSSQEAVKAQFEPVINAVLTALKESGLTDKECRDVLANVKEKVALVVSKAETSLNISKEKVLEKKLGKEYGKHTLSELDEILKS